MRGAPNDTSDPVPPEGWDRSPRKGIAGWCHIPQSLKGSQAEWPIKRSYLPRRAAVSTEQNGFCFGHLGEITFPPDDLLVNQKFPSRSRSKLPEAVYQKWQLSPCRKKSKGCKVVRFVALESVCLKLQGCFLVKMDFIYITKHFLSRHIHGPK